MNILYIMSSYNIYGGTPKKTLDLIKHSGNNSSLYVYHNIHNEFKGLFESAGANITEGFFGRNLFQHIDKLLKIIDTEDIQIVQTQFTMGEVLGYMIKYFRPHVKLIVAFVGPFVPRGVKKPISKIIYQKVDAFVYISQYIQKEKTSQFPILANKKNVIIFNGTEKRATNDIDVVTLNSPSFLDVARLGDWKNANILIEAMNIIVHQQNKNVYLYLVGDGPERDPLTKKIHQYNLDKYIFLLGNQTNIGSLLEQCTAFVHPAYAEGFGIAVAEAMIAKKPVMVANAGALPELIENRVSGLVINPFDANAWAEGMVEILENNAFANDLASNALLQSKENFSIEQYVKSYQSLYLDIMDK